jgi:hypothetical protein
LYKKSRAALQQPPRRKWTEYICNRSDVVPPNTPWMCLWILVVIFVMAEAALLKFDHGGRDDL